MENTNSINDILGDGGLQNVAILEEDTSGNTVLVGADGEPISLAGGQKDTLITVVCGNSIAGGVTNISSYKLNNEIELSNMLSGAPLTVKRMTPTTRSDRFGTYAYSGQTLPTILADLQVQWIDQINGAGVYPDLVVGYSLQENDIAGGLTVAAMQKSLSQWINLVKATWPGALIHLVCPRPSLSYNTADKVSAYQSMRDHYLSLDDGATVFVSRADGYESATSPGTPIVGGCTGSITASTSFIVTDVDDGTVLGVGMTVHGLSGVITAMGTATGGAGTYTMSVSQTVASNHFAVGLYTDSSVHPNSHGAMKNARLQAATLRRIGRLWKPRYVRTYSTNAALSGTGAASGTNVTGTVPTNVTCTGSANGVFVVSADQPGFTQTVTVGANPNAALLDTATSNFGALSIATSGVDAELSPFIVYEIVSGAENLDLLQNEYRAYKVDATNEWQYGMRTESPDVELDWQNGDVITVRMPPMKTTTASAINRLDSFIRFQMRRAGGTATIKVIQQGVGVIVP